MTESPTCDLCKEIITKYKMDLASGDSVEIKVSNTKEWRLICGDCARKIGTKLINS